MSESEVVGARALRDEFAKAAMAALIGNHDLDDLGYQNCDAIANIAYDIADRMLKARDRKTNFKRHQPKE